MALTDDICRERASFSRSRVQRSEDFTADTLAIVGGKKEVPSPDAMKDSAGVEMDTEVWGNLSHELLPLILVRLPWWSNLQLRSVCKAWNSMLRNQKLLSKFSPIHLPPPTGSLCCILSTREECKILHSSVRKWHSLPRSLILPKLATSDCCFEVVAATSGLFLMEGSQERTGRFLVNPFNGTQRQLPPGPTLQDGTREITLQPPLRMIVDDQTHNVKVVEVQFESKRFNATDIYMQYLFSSDPEAWRIYVFDLLTNSWDLVSNNLRTERFQTIKNAVLLGNDLYLLTKQPGTRHWYRHRVFKALATSLVEIPMGQMAIDVPTVHLFQHRGRLMIVRGTNETIPSVDIWSLDQVREKWVQVASMPDNFLTLLYSRQEGCFNFDAEGDYICLASYCHLELIVVYNLVENVWGYILCEDSQEDSLFQNLEFPDTFIWQPRLDIVL